MRRLAFSRTVKAFRIPVILAVFAAGLLPFDTSNAQRYTNRNVRPPLIIETPGRAPHAGGSGFPGTGAGVKGIATGFGFVVTGREAGNARGVAPDISVRARTSQIAGCHQRPEAPLAFER